MDLNNRNINFIFLSFAFQFNSGQFRRKRIIEMDIAAGILRDWGGGEGGDSVDFQSTEDPQSIRKNPAISDYAFATFRLQSIYPTWKFNPIPSIFFFFFRFFLDALRMLQPSSALHQDALRCFKPSLFYPRRYPIHRFTLDMKIQSNSGHFTLLFHSSLIHHPEEEAADPSSQRFSLFSFENQIVMCSAATRSIGSIQRQLYHRQ